MTRDERDCAIRDAKKEIAEIRKESELKGFNQTWNDVLDDQERINRLEERISQLRSLGFGYCDDE